jgi:hypothetical protein
MSAQSAAPEGDDLGAAGSIKGNVRIVSFRGRPPQNQPRRCCECGYPIPHHAPHHQFCRRCYGYLRLWTVYRQAIADITASSP